MGVANFDKDLIKGKKWESYLLSHPLFCNRIKPHSNYKNDFVFSDGKILELKTELGYTLKPHFHGKVLMEGERPIRHTENVFIERFSKKETSVLGGPWQAAQKSVFMYAHFFPYEKDIYFFELSQMLEFLEKRITSGVLNPSNLKSIPNRGYTTQGWAVNFSNMCKNVNVFRLNLDTGTYDIK